MDAGVDSSARGGFGQGATHHAHVDDRLDAWVGDPSRSEDRGEVVSHDTVATSIA